MERHVIYILSLFSLAFAQRVPPEIEYLRGVPRFNNESFMDYYFTCSTVGKILQWRVNGVVFGFTGTETTTGTIKPCTASNFQCITTVLSFKSSQAGLFTFYSFLIVSTTTSRNVFNVVTCGNDIEFTSVSTNNTGTAQNVILNRRSQNVFFQYLFSANIVNNSTTYVYLCGVNDVIQIWQTNGLSYVFTNNTDAIVQNLTFLSADQTLAVQQTFLMGREPYLIISILLLSIPYVNVTCASSQFPETLLFSDVQSTTVTTPPPTAPPTTTEGFTTPAITNDSSVASIGTIKNMEQASDTVTIVTSVLVVLFIAMVLPALIIGAIRCYRRRKNPSKETVVEAVYHSEDSHSLKTTDPPPQENINSEDNGSLAGTVLLKENGNGVSEKESTSPWKESGQQYNEHPVYSSSVTKKEVYMQNNTGKFEDEENSAEQVGVAIAPLPYSGPKKGTITGKSGKVNRRECQPERAINRSDNLPNLQAPRPPEDHDSSEDHDSVVANKDHKAAVYHPGIKQVSNTLAQNTTTEEGLSIFAAVVEN